MKTSQLSEQVGRLSDGVCKMAQDTMEIYAKKNNISKKALALEKQSKACPDTDTGWLGAYMDNKVKMFADCVSMAAGMVKEESEEDKLGIVFGCLGTQFVEKQKEWMAQKKHTAEDVGKYLDICKYSLETVQAALKETDKHGESLKRQAMEIMLLYGKTHMEMVSKLTSRSKSLHEQVCGLESTFVREKMAIDAMLFKWKAQEEMMDKLCGVLENALAG